MKPLYCKTLFMLQFVLVLLATIDGNSRENAIGMVMSNHSNSIIPSLYQSIPDSLPSSKESFTIRKSTGDEDVLLKMVEGQVTLLEINGKTIDKSEYPQYQSYIDALTKTPLSGEENGFSFQFNQRGIGNISQDIWLDLDSIFQDFSPGTTNGVFGPSAQFRFHSGSFNLDSLMEQMAEWTKKWQEDFPSMEGQLYGFEEDFDSDDWSDADYSKSDEAPVEFTTILGNALNKDGLLIPGKENEIELSYKSLKINGEKQPENIFQKYKRLFESAAGTALQKKSKIKFAFTGKESNRKFRVY